MESWEARRQANLAKGINGNGQGTPLAIAARQLLPTRRVSGGSDIMGPAPSTLAGGHGNDLGPAIGALLPTPNWGDARHYESMEHYRERDARARAANPKLGALHLPLPTVVEALLKTPTAQLAVNGGSQHPDKRREGGHGPTLADQVEHELLPTPRATDGTKGGPNQRGSSGDLMLPSAVMGLLPTPTARDHKGPNQRRDATCLHGALLPTPLSADGGLNRGSSAGYGLRNVSREIARGDRLLPTPMAADGDRQSLTMPRGNPTLAGALLPTPRCADGMVASNMQSNRDRLEGGARRRGTLEEEISLMPGESDGDLTARQSPGGKPSSDGQHQGQLSLDGLEKDFLPDS